MLVFLCTYKDGFLFLYIYGPVQVVSYDLLWYGKNNIGLNHENNVPCGSLSHFLVLDRLESLII